MRTRELARVREHLAQGDLAAAGIGVTRLARLFPLDEDVRALAARVRLAEGDERSAAAHLFLTSAATVAGEAIDGPVAARLLLDFTGRAERDPLAAFFALELRDVPDLAQLAPEPRARVERLLADLAQKDYPALRLDAMLYGRRRGLTGSDRAQALGCLALFGLVMLAVAVLAALGFISLF